MRAAPQAELIWASPRELLNVIQANEIGCHVITVTPELLAKLSLLGKDLTEYSLTQVDRILGILVHIIGPIPQPVAA